MPKFLKRSFASLRQSSQMEIWKKWWISFQLLPQFIYEYSSEDIIIRRFELDVIVEPCYVYASDRWAMWLQ